MPISFFVPGVPKGQPRVRAFVRGRRASVYDPGTADDWKATVYLEARRSRPQAPMTGPVSVSITFIFPRPLRLCRAKDPAGRLPHTAKPDRDNAEKAVLDALTQAGYWRDDAQVCAGSVRKFYAAKGERTGAEITVEPIEETAHA